MDEDERQVRLEALIEEVALFSEREVKDLMREEANRLIDASPDTSVRVDVLDDFTLYRIEREVVRRLLETYPHLFTTEPRDE